MREPGAAGAPPTPRRSASPPTHLRRTIANARFLRSRYTVLDLLDETGLLAEAIDAIVPARLPALEVREDRHDRFAGLAARAAEELRPAAAGVDPASLQAWSPNIAGARASWLTASAARG